MDKQIVVYTHNEVMIHAITWINLKILSEIKEARCKNVWLYKIFLLVDPQRQFRLVIARYLVEGEEYGEQLLNGYSILFCGDEKVLELGIGGGCTSLWML